MLRRIMIVVTGAALLATLAGCNNDSGGGGGALPSVPAGSKMEEIQKRGKLIVGTKYDQPGFGNKSLAGDQPEGFDVEVGKLVAKAIFGDDTEGRVEFQEAPTPQREDLIEKGTVDLVVATYSITDARKQRVGFAGPYLIAGQSLLVKKSDNSITDPGSLAGKKVCSVQGSTPLNRIREQAPQANTELVFPTYAECVEALKDGRIDAVTTDDQILLGYAADAPDEIKVVGKPFSQEKYGIGVKKDDKTFRDFINDTLEKVKGDGSLATAYTDTIGAKTGAEVPSFPAVERY